MSTQEKIPLNIIACKVLQDLLEAILPEHLAGKITFMDYRNNSSGSR